MLAHANDECTGFWRLQEETVACSVCRRAHPATPENRATAMEENFAGRMLQRATLRGTTLLARERARS